jgi:hypothetical protein
LGVTVPSGLTLWELESIWNFGFSKKYLKGKIDWIKEFLIPLENF